MAALRDLVSNLAVRESIRPAVATGSVTGEIVDTRGFDSVAAVLAVGAVAGSGNQTPKLQHSHTTTGGDFEDVAAAELSGSFPAALVENSVVKVGYAGGRRYLRLVVTHNSGTSVARSGVIVLGNPDQRPA